MPRLRDYRGCLLCRHDPGDSRKIVLFAKEPRNPGLWLAASQETPNLTLAIRGSNVSSRAINIFLELHAETMESCDLMCSFCAGGW